MAKRTLKIYEYIIPVIVALIFIIIGSFNDLNISKALYNSSSPNLFGVVMSGISEIPSYFITAFVGILLVFTAFSLKKLWKIISIVVGVGVTAFGTYFIFDTFKNIYKFETTNAFKTPITVIGAILAVSLLVGAILFTIFKLKNVDKNLLRNIALMIICVMAIQIIAATILKPLISRPRPRYILSSYGSEEEFRMWFMLNPFQGSKIAKDKSLLYGVTISSDEFKSAPSGHTSTASILIILLPLLGFIKDDNNKRRTILFYVGLIFTILAAISRVVAGAHFMSDVGLGMLLGSLTCLFVDLLFPVIVNKFLNKE